MPKNLKARDSKIAHSVGGEIAVRRKCRTRDVDVNEVSRGWQPSTSQKGRGFDASTNERMYS